MKKIFTLIAVAAMALSANAQEQYVIADGFTPTNGQEVQATASVMLKYGIDNKWQNKPEGTLTGYTCFVTGSQNPKDGEPTEDSKSTGNGYKSATQNLPHSGVFYVFTPSASGTIKLGVQLNADKTFVLADGADGTCLSDKVTFEDAEGNAVTYQEGGENEYSLSDKLVGFANLPVEANKVYYVFCVGSKLGIYGFTFTGGETSIKGIEAAADVNAPAYNLAGQKVGKDYKGVVIQNGRKMLQK